MSYEQKYLKYKAKYLALKAELEGGLFGKKPDASTPATPNNADIVKKQQEDMKKFESNLAKEGEIKTLERNLKTLKIDVDQLKRKESMYIEMNKDQKLNDSKKNNNVKELEGIKKNLEKKNTKVDEINKKLAELKANKK